MALLNSCCVEVPLELLVGIKIPGSLSSGWVTCHPFVNKRMKLSESSARIIRSIFLGQQ